MVNGAQMANNPLGINVDDKTKEPQDLSHKSVRIVDCCLLLDLFNLCPPLTGAYYLHTSEARAIFVDNDGTMQWPVLCNWGYWRGTQTGKILCFFIPNRRTS